MKKLSKVLMGLLLCASLVGCSTSSKEQVNGESNSGNGNSGGATSNKDSVKEEGDASLYGNAVFLKEIQLIRNDVALSSPWFVADLAQLGLTQEEQYNRKDGKNEPFQVEAFTNTPLKLDGAYKLAGSNQNSVIIYAYNLTGRESTLNEMTIQKIRLSEGSDEISFNGDIFIGAKREDIIKAYGNPMTNHDQNLCYRLNDAEKELHNGQKGDIDIQLYLNFDENNILFQIDLHVDDQIR